MTDAETHQLTCIEVEAGPLFDAARQMTAEGPKQLKYEAHR